MPPHPRLRLRSASSLVTGLLLVSCGGDGATDPQGDGSPLAAPGSMSAEALSGSRIRVAWSDDTSGETGFRIERSAAGDGWVPAGETAADVTSFDDTGLQPDTRYAYRVRAEAGSEVSAWSPTAEATTLTGELGVVLEVERTIESVVPPVGTPLGERNLLDEVNAVGEALRSVPGVDTVLVWERVLTVQAVLDNGMTHLFVHNRIPELEQGPPGVPAAVPPAATDGPPGSKRAVAVAFDGGAEVAAEVAALLGGVGYDVLSLGAGVEDMRRYQDLGALYLDTHGTGWGLVNANGRIIGQTFGFQTSTVIEGSSMARYKDELVAGDLVFESTQTASGIATTYAVTEQFIRKYWSFDDGIVMVHACYAGAGAFTMSGVEFVPAALGVAILDGGGEVYASFDHLTDAYYARPSVLYFWDRLLGANVHEPADPPLRPFDVPEVRSGMDREGLLTYERPEGFLPILGFRVAEWGGNVVNVTFLEDGDRATAAPSIRTVDVVDDVDRGAGELRLNGLFGDERGTVEVEGVDAPVTSWSPDRVVARVPYDGLGSVGPVRVKTADGVKSNEVPLTEWAGTVTATTTIEGSMTAEAVVDFRFRADVHAFRSSILGEPRHRSVTTYLNPASSGRTQGSGTFTYPDGSRTTLSGSYDLRILTKAEVDAGGIEPEESAMGARITLDPAAGTAEICLLIWGEVDATGSGVGTRALVLVGGAAPLYAAGDTSGYLGCTTQRMDPESYVIEAFDQTVSEDEYTWRLRWGAFRPVSPPDDRTAG